MNKDIKTIVDYSISQCKPNITLKKEFKNFSFNSGRLIVIAVGKASWLMAKTISELSAKKIDLGIIITKYNHSKGPIENFEIYEAGHPIIDENGLVATKRVLEVTKNLNSTDDIIFLLSGGASALFEEPKVDLRYLQTINQKLIFSNANILEINTIRKRLSNVKGGKFARHCYPAKVSNFILSDVISQDLSSIGSGPTVNDSSSILDAFNINQKYNLNMSEALLNDETIDNLDNIQTTIIGSVEMLANSAKDICEKLGYQTTIVENDVDYNYLLLKDKLLKLAKNNQNPTNKLAFIFSGEITLEVDGTGLGGRNQHLVLSCAKDIKELNQTTIICFGSDGTDGPTDAAGGFVDDNTFKKANSLGLDIEKYLNEFDSYNCLKKLDQLIITGATDTNVNDLYLLLIE